MDKKIENLYEKIIELSNSSLQRKLWLNENNDTGLISSYSELMCSLFDDFGFDEFVDTGAVKIGLSNSLIFELNCLREMLNAYVEKESDKEIINDIEWGKIIEQAKIVVEKWNTT
jgi:hypothetical protein